MADFGKKSRPASATRPSRVTTNMVEPPLGEQGADNAPVSPSPDEIAARAYARYESRGGEDGHDVEDWLEAERELRDGSGTHDAAAHAE